MSFKQMVVWGWITLGFTVSPIPSTVLLPQTKEPTDLLHLAIKVCSIFALIVFNGQDCGLNIPQTRKTFKEAALAHLKGKMIFWLRNALYSAVFGPLWLQSCMEDVWTECDVRKAMPWSYWHETYFIPCAERALDIIMVWNIPALCLWP